MYGEWLRRRRRRRRRRTTRREQSSNACNLKVSPVSLLLHFLCPFIVSAVSSFHPENRGPFISFLYSPYIGLLHSTPFLLLSSVSLSILCVCIPIPIACMSFCLNTVPSLYIVYKNNNRRTRRSSSVVAADFNSMPLEALLIDITTDCRLIFKSPLDPAGPDCKHSAQYYYKRKAECCVLKASIYTLFTIIFTADSEREEWAKKERERYVCNSSDDLKSWVLTHCVRRNGNYIHAWHRGAATADLTDWLAPYCVSLFAAGKWKQHRAQSLSDALCMLDAVKSPRQKTRGLCKFNLLLLPCIWPMKSTVRHIGNHINKMRPNIYIYSRERGEKCLRRYILRLAQCNIVCPYNIYVHFYDACVCGH